MCKFRYYLANHQISGIIKSRYSPENIYLLVRRGMEKGKMLTLLYQRKTDWYQDSGYEI